jgi:hypothetical protein
MSEIETDLHPVNFTVYLVGVDLDDAKRWNPYDSLEEAQDFAASMLHGMGKDLKVFKATAMVDFNSAEEIKS